MEIPECLGARGRTDRGGDGDFRFGSSMHGEEIYQKDKANMPGFLGMFCRTTLPWYYLSRLERQRFENDALYYSDGVVARTEGGKRVIRKGEFVLREDDDVFVPALWHKREIIAYSRTGYSNKSWQLPDDWHDVKSVDLHRITLEGCLPLKQRVTVTQGKLILSLEKEESISIVPAGAKLAGKTAAIWPVGKAKEWYDKQAWLVGCNFLPSTAVNDVEMWQAETFDPATIDRELGWAQDLGLNTVRVFVNYVVWEADAVGLERRFARFLGLAQRHGISVMPILFDDCNFAGRIAAPGKQPDPIPGVHNSQWVASPPLAMVIDRAVWPKLERYVKGMVGAFGSDRRVVIWDLYNEPGNSGLGGKSQPLMEAAFAWARQAKPRQPITTGAWEDFNSPLSRRMMELSDVVSFHGYDSPAGIEAKLKLCAGYGRPLLCTEWLLRRDGNSFETLLSLFRDRKVACWNWGLVAGRTQTYFPWGSPRDAPEPKTWQHDIFRADGTPFNAREARFIKQTVGGQ